MVWQMGWCYLENTIPHLHSYAKNKHITLAQATNLDVDSFYDMFYLPMSSIAVQQSNVVRELINNKAGIQSANIWQFYWGGTKYSNNRIYLEYIGNPPDAPKPFHWTWKSCSLSKQKLFFWSLLQDMLNTRDLLMRKSFHIESSRCVVCNDEPNDHFTHLFFSYDFSHYFWLSIRFQWNTNLNMMELLVEGK